MSRPSAIHSVPTLDDAVQPDPSHAWAEDTRPIRCTVCGAYKHLSSGFMPCKAPAPEQPPTWAKVELMGHVTLAGKLSEEEKFGGKLGRVDVPGDVECPRCKGTNGDNGAFNCGMCIAGRVGGSTTQYFGHQSVYRITLCTEAVARHIARNLSAAAPVSPWDFPKALPAAGTDLPDTSLDDETPDITY